MRRNLACVIACFILAACGRDTNDATTNRAAHASSSASAPVVATSAKTASANGAHDPETNPTLPKNAFVLPGAIDADTDLAELRQVYGAANIKEGDLPSPGDDPVHGVILFPVDPKRRAYVYFQNAKTLTGLSMVGILDKGSQWRSAQGVRIGMSLDELVALNGKPFEFFGFDGVYGGWISDWTDGRLATTTDGMSLHVRLSHLAFPKGVPDRELPNENYRSFRSDHPQLAKMKVVVDEISLNFPGQDDR